uniref:Uncharacterized protein n=1 Tax=Anguilla anguilla TaxID=7936 RepID=A0A0E9SPE4_ANGAN
MVYGESSKLVSGLKQNKYTHQFFIQTKCISKVQ